VPEQSQGLRAPHRRTDIVAMTGHIIVGIAIGVVALVLIAGLYTLFKGGDISRSWSNKLMRVRVVAQFVAILVIMAVFYFTGHR
jgi:hypothetical protein